MPRNETAALEFAWHALDGQTALERVKASIDGLEESEVAERLRVYGPNLLPRRKPAGLLVLYLRQFKDPLVYLLLAATLVSLALGHLTDALFIFAVLQVNAMVGGYQQWRADESAAALNALISQRATVLRGGREREVEATELVPGDIVGLQSGARVPADMRLLKGKELQVDESLLTGESVPVTKAADPVLPLETPLAEKRNLLFAGTTVIAGRANAIRGSLSRQPIPDFRHSWGAGLAYCCHVSAGPLGCARSAADCPCRMGGGIGDLALAVGRYGGL